MGRQLKSGRYVYYLTEEEAEAVEDMRFKKSLSRPYKMPKAQREREERKKANPCVKCVEDNRRSPENYPHIREAKGGSLCGIHKFAEDRKLFLDCSECVCECLTQERAHVNKSIKDGLCGWHIRQRNKLSRAGADA